jgi:hypothetical protein
LAATAANPAHTEHERAAQRRKIPPEELHASPGFFVSLSISGFSTASMMLLLVHNVTYSPAYITRAIRVFRKWQIGPKVLYGDADCIIMASWRELQPLRRCIEALVYKEVFSL